MKIIHWIKNYPISAKTCVAAISVLYLLVSGYLYTKYGAQLVNDSPRYLGYAENLSNGFYFDPLNFWYISYVFFIYLGTSISDSLNFLIFNQYLLGYFGMLALFAGTRKLTGSVKTATLVAIIFIVFPDNLMWNSYILTESFYQTFICICFFLFIRLYKQPENKKIYFLLIPAMLICFFSKPTSPALFLAVLAPHVFNYLKRKQFRFLKIGGLIVASVLFLVLANKMISSHYVLLIYQKGDIIFAMHELPNHPNHDSMTIEVPENLFVPEKKGALLINMFNFIVKNPFFFAKLMVNKVIMYITHIRPFWSSIHNISIILVLWSLYFFCLSAIRKKVIPRQLIFSFLAYFTLHTLVVAITWVDWDGRFFVPLIPFIVVLGTIGLVENFRNKK